MKHRCYVPALAAAVSLAMAAPLTVHAQSLDGYLNDDTVLLAGPAPQYPEIESLPYGTYVSVQGCTEGWEWCDVVADQGDWGWVPGDYIDYVYEGEPVLVPEYGPRIGIPIVSFSINSYWDAHYRDRPFYRERSTWYHRDIPHRAPPPHRASRRGPPPPPPGGWHQGGHSAHTMHHAGGASSHQTSSSQHERAQPQQHHAAQAPHHENPPNPPRVPVNAPPRPSGDHHASIPTPPMAAPPHPVPPHNRHVPPPHPASSSGHGKHPQHPQKKHDHDNGDDNGH